MKELTILLLSLSVLASSCNRKVVNSTSNPISHSIWDTLLIKHVSDDGRVDYKGFMDDKAKLKTYLKVLSDNHPNLENWSEQERLAYWINAYNAFTVDLIVQHYPVASIKDIKKGIPYLNSVWDMRFFEIGGKKFNLSEIEHGILRKEFEEPRIHFAIVCASISCPQLRNGAFTALDLEKQLQEQTESFFNNESKNKITAEGPKISKIFKWFEGDFTKKGTLIDYINQYSGVKIQADAEIDYLDYDWGLNE